MELVKIGEKNLGVKEFEGKRVVTAWDVAEVHEKPTYRVNEQFERNKKYFTQGEDFIEITKEEFCIAFSDSEINIPNNVKMIRLFTESGYMMLVKTFTDEKSWQVQRELVRGYFMAREFTADYLSAKERLELWRYFKKVYEQPADEEQNNISNEYMMKFVEQTTKMMEQMTATMAVMTNIMSKNTEVNTKSEEIKPKTKREELKELVQKIKKGRLVSGGKFTILYDRIKKDKGIDVRKAARQNLLDWIEKNGYLEECIKTAKLIIAEQEA